MARKIEVIIAGDTSGLERALGKAKTVTSGFASHLGGIARVAGGVFTGQALFSGARALVDQFGSFVAEAREAEKVGKLTAQVIKTTGGVAGVTAKHVDRLATAISNKTGIDDEAIAASQNLLLTFTNVRNEAGRGNQIFDRATGLIQDMSVALGQDGKAGAIQLGKALNDPIKGVTALSRVGVSFTKEQKEQIKTLVESGRTLEAQKIILDELGKEFGGAAEAAATPTDKLRVTVGNLKEEFGKRLIPVIDKAAAFLSSALPKAARVLAPVFRTIGQGLRAMGAAFSGEGVTSDGFVGVMERIGVAARSLVDWFQANWPRIREIVAQVLDQVQVVIDNIISWVRDHWPEIQEVIAQVLDTVRSVISGAVTVILTLWRNFGDNILSFLRRAWNPIKQIVEGALTVVRGIIQTVTSLIKGDWSGVWDGIKKIFSGVWEALQGIVKGALEAIRLAIGFVLEIIGSIFKKAWDGIKTVASNAWDGIVDFFGKLPGRFGGVLSGVADAITAPFKTAFNLIADLWNNTVGKLRFEIPSWVPRIGGKGWDVPDIPKFAHGAVVRRPTLAVVGDAGPGNPEIVAPERMLRRIVTDALTIAPLTRSTATVVNTTNITVNALDARGTQDAVVRALNDYRRRNGRLPWEAVA